jgi:DNA polymerase-3 subunit beta
MNDVDFLSQPAMFETKTLSDEVDLEIKIDRNLLLGALSHAQSIVEKRNILPILSNVRLDAFENTLSIMATDMDLLISEKIQADVIKSSSLTISAHVFYDIVRKLPSDSIVTLTANSGTNNKVVIESTGCKFELPYLESRDFPKMDYTSMGYSFKLSSAELQSLIDKSKFTMSTEETRYNLNGIYLHTKDKNGTKVLRAVATDGHRLSCIDIGLPDGAEGAPGVIIPRKSVLELRKILEDTESEVEVSLSENRIKFAFDSVELLTKLIDGNFPEYEGLIPVNNQNWMKVNKDTFSKAVDRVSTIAFEKSRAVKLIISGDILELHVSGEDMSHAKETIKVESGCIDLQIGFNSRYILDALSAVNGDTVEFRLLDSFSPAIIRDVDDDSYCQVIMPMRV